MRTCACLVFSVAVVAVAECTRQSFGQAGYVSQWGGNVVAPPFEPGSVVDLDANIWHGLALKSDGSIVAWGDNGYGQCALPDENSGFVAVAAAMYHSSGLKEDGTIVHWGRIGFGQAPGTGYVALSAGGEHTAALKADGSIVVFGGNPYYNFTAPAPNSGFHAITSSPYDSIVGLRQDGSIVVWGEASGVFLNVPAADPDFVAIAAGGSHGLALRKDGSIVSWGSNTYECRNQIQDSSPLRLAYITASG